VVGEDGQVEGAVLVNDWSVPHASYYRPPVKFRCRDGFLALPDQVTAGQASDWSALQIEVRRNGTLVQTVDLRDLMRDVPTLLADVGEFMTLQPGDVLMVGSDCLADGTRPRAKADDRVEISAPGFASVITTVRGAA
jgi:5-oxopent-3-ene-1,2,5-tricarboxylate decarboxylase/2-hydroxyhepta-2,4-diene-1,7-dioate isomerase